MKSPLLLRLLALWLLAIGPVLCAQEGILSPEMLKALLARFPEADANKDGVLTEDEARAYYEKMRSRRAPAPSIAPAPTWADVSYGPAMRNVLDFWQAKSDRPTPVVIYIHGGGFVGGDKSKARDERLVQQCLDAGVSFASINYRYLSPAAPIQEVLRDCARAVQFIRSKSAEWNVDKPRIASYGASAGAGSSIWLATHDDLADPKSADSVLRESSRLVCAGAISTQFSYDFPQWTEVFGAETVQRFKGIYGSPALYGLKSEAELAGPAGQKIRADCDMLGLISKDDVPLFFTTSLPDLTLENTNQFLHHPKHAQLLYERAQAVGLSVVASIPALGIKPPAGGPTNWRDFAFKYLGVTVAGAGAK